MARAVATATKPGRHNDGDGLYLVVDASGAKRRLFLFRWQGKLKEMGLGGLSSVSLAEARERAGEARRVLKSGLNPIEQRRTAKVVVEEAVTFSAFADTVVADLLARLPQREAQGAVDLDNQHLRRRAPAYGD